LTAAALVKKINAAIAGWVNYFRVGNSSRAFSEVRDYVEMKKSAPTDPTQAAAQAAVSAGGDGVTNISTMCSGCTGTGNSIVTGPREALVKAAVMTETTHTFRRISLGELLEGKLHEQLCVQERWTRSAGINPVGARIRSPVAWIARWRETKTLKPIDEAIGRMVANHQAVAQANATSARVSKSRGPSLQL